MRRLALLSLLCGASAWADHDAVIWTSETTEEAAAAQLAKAPAALKAAGLTLADGWPRVVKSDGVTGLKAGFHVIMIGYCPESDTARVLMRAKAAQRLSYVRKVTLNAAQAKEARCPGLDPSIKPPPAPAYLVAETAKTKQALESLAEKLKHASTLELPDGFPKIVETKTLKIAAPPGRTADKFLLLLGVCEVTRAEVVIASSGLYDTWPAWALQDAPMACPAIGPQGVAKALEKALALEEPDLVKELALRTTDAADRVAAMKYAATGNRAAMVRALLQTFGKENAYAGEVLSSAFDVRSTEPDAFARRRDTVAALMEAGAVPTSDELGRAVGACDAPLVKLFVEKAVRPAPGQDLLAVGVYCPPELVSLLFDKGLVKPGGPSEGHVLVNAAPEVLELLLKYGASLDAKDAQGLSLLDVLMLFPAQKDPGREALFKSRPALGAAWNGDLPALSKLNAADVDKPVGEWTPLLVAATAGKAAAVKKLLEQGAKADAPLALGGSPLGKVDALALALDSRDEDTVAALLDKGAPVNGLSGLCCEVRSSGEARSLALARGGAGRFQPETMGARPKGQGWSPDYGGPYRDKERYPVTVAPLARAAAYGMLSSVKRLLEKGAALDQADPATRLTALMLAGQQGNFDVFELLLEKGAQVDLVDDNGTSVLGHLVLGKPSAELVGKVLKKKKGVAQSKGLLTLAAMNTSVEVLQLLISNGAGKNGQGLAAVKLVCQRGDRGLEASFDALEAAGYKSGQRYYGGCVREGD